MNDLDLQCREVGRALNALPIAPRSMSHVTVMGNPYACYRSNGEPFDGTPRVQMHAFGLTEEEARAMLAALNACRQAPGKDV